MPLRKQSKKTRGKKYYKMRGCSKKLLGGKNAYINPSRGPNPYGFNFPNSQITKGGSCGTCHMRGGNYSVGKAWSATNWPSMNNANHFSKNTYNNDISRQMKAAWASGGRRGKQKTQKKQRGGVLSNGIGQDFVNLGRQLTSGAGNIYNSSIGRSHSVSPQPWLNQLPGTLSVSTLKKMAN